MTGRRSVPHAACVYSLTGLLTEGDGDLHARFLLGMLHWHRCQGLPSSQDLSAAVTVLTPCFAAGIGAFPPALARALAEHAMPAAIAALQRAAYSADPDAVQGAVDIWERIRDAIPPGHPRYAACQAATGMALQTRFGRTGDPADLDAAIRAHQAAADAADAAGGLRPPLNANGCWRNTRRRPLRLHHRPDDRRPRTCLLYTSPSPRD